MFEKRSNQLYFDDAMLKSLGYEKEDLEPTYESFQMLQHPDDRHP